MVEIRVCWFLFFFAFLAAVTKIQSSIQLHRDNKAFIHDESDIQYLLDSIPNSINKGFTNSVHGSGGSIFQENIQDTLCHIKFEPNILDFQQRQLGIPHQETVTLFNTDNNRTIHLSSISANTQNFHSSFFQDKVIIPLGNTTFNVVFLGREQGEIDSYLFVHTSDGIIKYQVKGVSVSNLYRLHPVLAVKLPINASCTALVYMHNPNSEPMQLIEVYSSGREFQLELPSGEVEASRELWEISPYRTKPIIRLNFTAYTEKNHTAYIRFRINNSAEILIVAVEIEVSSGAGLHWGGSSGVINFGIGGSYQSPIHYQIALKNSAKKPIKVQNVISTPISKALKINFEPIMIPGDTEIPIEIGNLAYDWKAGLDLKHFKGKLIVKGIGPGRSNKKLVIPWKAEVLHGGLEVNTSAAHYCSLHSSQPRNFSVINKFELPLAITNVSLPIEAESLFTISNFAPKILRPGEREDIFTLSLTQDKMHENLQLQSWILIHSNVSTMEIPLLRYNGKLQKIIPEERKSDRGTMNFGTVSSGTVNEGIFGLENHNPVNIELNRWGVNMFGAVLELVGCQNVPIHLFNKDMKNITSCSIMGNQNIKPGYSAIFKIKVKTPSVKEDAIVGYAFVRTIYERLTIPIYIKVTTGKISIKKLTLTDCFPGSICVQDINIHSTFVRPMNLIFIAPVHKDERVKYIPLEPMPYPFIFKGDNHVGSIMIDLAVTCKQHCYLGLSLNSSAGSQWLNTFSLPSLTRDFDLNLLKTRYTQYLNVTNGHYYDNIIMQLDTNEVRGYNFDVTINFHWPTLLVGVHNAKQKRVLSFPLTQVKNISYKTVTLHNPTLNLLLVHLVMDWNYPQGMRLFHSLPNELKPLCSECPSTIHGEFKLEDNLNQKEFFKHKWLVTPAQYSLPLVLEPNKTKTIRLSYSPLSADSSSAILYIRNNVTILEVLRLIGRAAHPRLKFGNRKPGSTTPLLFELTENHFEDCESQHFRKTLIPNLTVKCSFIARNTGELSIHIYAFYINGLTCRGYGFNVLNCGLFTLQPNATKKIEIAFTPDFTLSRIQRSLFIKTSIGSEAGTNSVHENGIVKLSLLTTVPLHTLKACAAIIARPRWENGLHSVCIGITNVLLICILATAFLEADRILRGALINISGGNLAQPLLDLKLLSQSSSIQHYSFLSFNNLHQYSHQIKEKFEVSCDDYNKAMRNKVHKKDIASPDWNLMNVKYNKEKDAQKGLKIPDWPAEEERRFRMDLECKNIVSIKRCATLDGITFETIKNSDTISLKKRSGKRHNVLDTMSGNGDSITINLCDIKLAKKKSSPFSKSSLIINRKDTVKGGIINEGSKRKQSLRNINSGNSNPNILKRYGHKITRFLEEEISSTTTESSMQEDTNIYKECPNNYEKTEQIEKNTITKKLKVHTVSVMPSLDYKDNYEGDCDDDEYDKEKQDTANRWKTTRTRSENKHNLMHLKSDSCYKISRQKQNPPRKEKTLHKRRNIEGFHLELPVTKAAHKEEVRFPSTTIFSPIAPPPLMCGGENRAKFSDVVARNQENFSPLSTFSHNNLRKINLCAATGSFNTDRSECTKQRLSQDLSLNEYKFNIQSACGSNIENGTIINGDLLEIQTNNDLHSYFANIFTELPYEAELVPYYDISVIDEPLTNLKNTEELSQCRLWFDDKQNLNLISEDANFLLDSIKTTEKNSNFADTLKETNWEPLYARGAVGEERSVAWGVNAGRLWAAAPWGTPTPPSRVQFNSLSRQRQLSIQECSDFDPFQSLSAIWRPSSSDTSTLNQKE